MQGLARVTIAITSSASATCFARRAHRPLGEVDKRIARGVEKLLELVDAARRIATFYMCSHCLRTTCTTEGANKCLQQ